MTHGHNFAQLFYDDVLSEQIFHWSSTPPPSLVTTLKRCFHCPIDFCMCLSFNRDHFSSMTCLSSSVFRNGFLRPAYTNSWGGLGGVVVIDAAIGTHSKSWPRFKPGTLLHRCSDLGQVVNLSLSVA